MPRHAPVRRTSVFERAYTIDDGEGAPIAAREFRNALSYYPQPGEQESIVQVMGNGAFSNTWIMRRRAARMVRRATSNNQAFKFVAYSDPLGGKAYAKEARDARLLRTVRHTARTAIGQLVVAGHSWIWPGAVDATQKVQDERPADARPAEVALLLGITPTNHRDPSRPRGFWPFVRSLAQETKHLRRAATSPGSYATMAELFGTAVTRFVSNPPAVIRASQETLDRTDTAKRVAALNRSHPNTYIAVVAAHDDAVYPADDTLLDLFSSPDNGFAGSFHSLPGTHLSTVTDPGNFDRIYDIVTERLAERREELLAGVALGQTVALVAA